MEDDDGVTISEMESRIQRSVSGNSAQAARPSTLSSARKTMSRLIGRRGSRESIVSSASNTKSVSSFMKGALSGGAKSVKSTVTGTSALESEVPKFANQFDSLTTKEKLEHLKNFHNAKPKDRPRLLTLIIQNDLFDEKFPTLQEQEDFHLPLMEVMRDLSIPEENQEELYKEMKHAHEFYQNILLIHNPNIEISKCNLAVLANLAQHPNNRTAMLADFHALWQKTVLDLVRAPKHPDLLKLALTLLQNLAMEEGNRVTLHTELKPVLKCIMDLVTQHSAQHTPEEIVRTALLLLGNLARHRYVAGLMGTSLKSMWPAMQDFLTTAKTNPDILSGVLFLMWNLSFAKDNEVFQYADLKPLLSAMMDMVRNAKSSMGAIQSVLGVWSNMALDRDNRSAIHRDLKAMWPMFLQFLTPAYRSDDVVYITLSLLNNLAFEKDNQIALYSELKPVWANLLGFVSTPRTELISEMTLLLIRNLAVVNENKVAIFTSTKPIWPKMMDLLRNHEANADSVYAITHLLWNLSRSSENRVPVYTEVQPMLYTLLDICKQHKSADSAYAVLAMLKNFAQAPENRQPMCADLQPYFDVFIDRFRAKDNTHDESEVIIWLMENLARDRANQQVLYKELKPARPILIQLLKDKPTDDIVEHILLYFGCLAMGKVHAVWVLVDLEECRPVLGELLSSANLDLVEATLFLLSNLATDQANAKMMYKEYSNRHEQFDLLVQYATAHDRESIREYALRLVSYFVVERDAMLELHPPLIALFESEEDNMDCVLALALLCGSSASLVAKWFADDRKVLTITKVLEDCTVTSEWGYEMERPLQALSHLLGVDAIRGRVKVNMLLEAVELSWKKRDVNALQYAFTCLQFCVNDDNNQMRFQGTQFLMDAAKSVSTQSEDSAQKRAAVAFLAKVNS